MASIAELWDRWERWLSRAAPELLEGLGPAATAADIAAAEAAMGVALPESLKALYAIHDGAAQIVGGSDIATLEGLVATRALLIEAEGEGARRWFPFVDHRGGDHDAVAGTGEVIEVAHDGESSAPLAASLEAWMEMIAGDLEGDLYRWNHDRQMFEPETLADGFRQSFDAVRRRLDRGLADLKRFTSAADVDAAVAQIGELVAVGFAGRDAQAAVFYKACARAALELASGSAVFEATRLVRALLPHAGEVGGAQLDRWHFARAAVDVAIAANDPELVREIDRDLVPALDLAAVVGPDETPEGVAALYNLACLHARFGDRDGCLRYAERALERGSPPDEMRGDPDFDPFASDPELLALLERFD